MVTTNEESAESPSSSRGAAYDGTNVTLNSPTEPAEPRVNSPARAETKPPSEPVAKFTKDGVTLGPDPPVKPPGESEASSSNANTTADAKAEVEGSSKVETLGGETATLASSTVGAADEVGAAGTSPPTKSPVKDNASRLNMNVTPHQAPDGNDNRSPNNGANPEQDTKTKPTSPKSIRRDKYCTKKKIWLGVAVGTILLGLIIVACLFSGSNNSQQQVLSEFYKANIDGSVKPCDDFYQYTCKKLAQSFQAKNVSTLNTRTDMLDRNLASLEQLLSQPVNSSHPTPLDQLRIFYQSCTDEDKIAADGTAPLLQLLRDVGGWTLLDRENNSSESWIDVVRRANEAGFVTTFPFRLIFRDDSKDSTKYAMWFTPLLAGQEPLPKEADQIAYMRKVAQLLNATNPALEDDMEKCVRFENALHKASNSSQTVREKSYEAQVLSSSIAWSQYFPAVFASSQVTITGSDSVTLADPNFDSRIAALLAETPVEVVRNYVVWRLIDGTIDFLPKDFRAAKRQFANQTSEKPRGRVCLQALRDKAEILLGFIYVQQFLDARIRPKVEVMLRDIKDEAREYLNEITWIRNETIKKSIIEKLNQLHVIIAYVNGSLEAGFVKELVDKLRIRPNDTALGNYRQLAGFYRNFRYGKLRTAQAEYALGIPFDYGIQADGLYFSSSNTSYILAGLMQRPFFDLDQPPSLSYGAIGFVMAHEITHGLKILSVCPNSNCTDFSKFSIRSNCTGKLYSGYTMKQVDQQVNGTRTLEENIGDTIGLDIAYRAHEKWLRKNNPPKRPIDDLEYSPRQWFWIAAATGLCSYANDEELKDEIAKGEHSPGEARVNVGFANHNNFWIDFNCTVGLPMNPEHKCKFN